MILARDFPILAPSGHDTTIVVGVYCCNSTRAIPDDSSDYAIGPLTGNADLNTIVGITKRKQITEAFQTNLVQRAITMVTDGDVLNQAMIDSLDDLPDAGITEMRVR